MNRVTLRRSCPSSPSCLLQTCLVAGGLACTTLPAWSLPMKVVSSSAIDLVEAGQRSGGAKGADASAVSRQPPALTPTATLIPQASTSNSKTQTLQAPAPAPSAPANTLSPTSQALNSAPPIDLDPALIERSPVLQRWLKQVPNVLSEIRRDPSFRTRLRLGYLQFPSAGQAAGLQLGIEDVFAGRSGLTLSADYQTAFNGKREAWGLDWRYYVRPLGSAVNLAPVVGYRHLETTHYSTDGVHVGLRLLLVPSRTGAADLSVTQSWVAPGSENEVGLTTLSFGYALTHNLRLSTDIQKQNSRFRSDSRVGIGLEWMF